MHGLSLFLFSTLPPQNILNTKPSSLDIFGLRYLNINIEDFKGGREEGSSNLRSFFEKCEPINPADKVLASWEFVWKCKQETSCVQAAGCGISEANVVLCCNSWGGGGCFLVFVWYLELLPHGKVSDCLMMPVMYDVGVLSMWTKTLGQATMTVQWKTLMDKQSKM